MKRSILQLIAIASAIFVLVGNAPASEYYNLSLSGIKLGESERIAGFEIKIKSGRIESLPRLPMGWHLIVDNDPSWSTSIQGIAIVGAAFLDADNRDLIQKLMVVERLTEGMVAEEIPFDVKATLHIWNAKTGKERTITEGKEKLLTPLKR